MIIAINTLLPKPFLKALVGSKFIPILGIATIVMMIIGAASFGGAYESLYEWWLGTGFYGGLIAGILNTVLAVLSFRVKE